MKNTLMLKGAFNFKKTLKYGKFATGKYISIYALEMHIKSSDCNNIPKNFLGICVSKKHGNSVVRNKLKRWAREAMKELEPYVCTRYYILVLYKKDTKQMLEEGSLSFFSVKDEMQKCFKSLNLLIGENE